MPTDKDILGFLDADGKFKNRTAAALGLAEVGAAPTAHAASHQNAGSDEISVADLSGLLADDQNPTAHATEHVDGTDDIQDADAAQKGLMTAIAQTFAGVKTFNNRVNSPSHSILTRRIECEVFTDAGINACMAELGATGGEVYLPEATCVITGTITIPQNNITLCGAGKGTILDASGGQAFHVIDVGTMDRCIIRDLQIIGNTGEVGTNNLIRGDGCTNTIISGCYLTNSDYDGISLDNADGSRITGNYLADVGNYGVYINGVGRVIISENVFNGGVHQVSISSGASFVKVLNNQFYDSVQNAILCAGDFIDIRGNLIYNSGKWGIYLSGSTHCKIIDNTIYEAANTRDDIHLAGGSHYAEICLNHCYSSAGNSERAIYLLSGDYAIVQGNYSEGHDTCGIQIDAASTNASIGGNILLDATKIIDNGTLHSYDIIGGETSGDGGVTNYRQTSKTGDTHFVGTAGLPYGEIWVKDNAAETAVAVAGTFVQFLGFTTDGSFNNTTPAHAQDHIEIDIAGDYLVTLSAHVSNVAGGLADMGSFTIAKNNGTTHFDNLHVHQRFAGGAATEQVISISGIIPNLAVNDTVEFWLTNDDNTTNLLVVCCNLTILQIGGAG